MNHSQIFLKQLSIAIESNSHVLITGQTGTGKSSLARQIHEEGKRRDGPFVVVNLATLHEGTLESELFGHERGAFTGAEKKRSGRLEMAHGGTLFLDEVGELSLRMQARLLEFFQSRRMTPLGSNREIGVDARVIAATHRNLQKAVSLGEFREDLFFRLRVISIALKSIKERSDEFDALVHTCLTDVSAQLGRPILRISEEVADALEMYDWPGNIRELKNVLECAVLSSSNGVITFDDLPIWFLEPESKNERLLGPASQILPEGLGVVELPLSFDFQETLERFQKEYFSRALRLNHGRISRTARQIGLNKTTFLRRVRAYGLGLS